MNNIISNSEIKVILGISGSSQDALIELWNQTATSMLASIFGIKEFGVHAVTEEKIKVYDPQNLVVSDFPVDFTETITVKDSQKTAFTGFTFEAENSFTKTIRLLDLAGKPTNLCFNNRYYGPLEVFVSYTAGYTTQETVESISYATLPDKTITVCVAGTATTWTFKATGASTSEINAETSDEITATNIAAALGGSATGAVVTLPLGTRIELGTALVTELTITAATIPGDLKNLVALMVGGGIAEKTKQGGIAELKIDDKTVKFRSNSDGNGGEISVANALINQWMPYMKSIDILAV